jgi:HPt (histidine-containing phosphotransfer) domain-containing protein
MALVVEITADGEREHISGPNSDRPVDLVHLARYTLGNRSLEREVLGLFHTQSEIYLQRLKEAKKDKDWVDAAHTIKGSARGIGAWQIARSAEAAEALNGKWRKGGALDVVKELERLIGEANGYIESLLSEAGSDETRAGV